MRTVELVKGIHSSALGFGCAPVLGSVDAGTAKRAIGQAIEFGINHFDLAPSYGYGEAEKFVGKLLKDRRHHVVLASKFGIRPNWKSKLFRPVKPLLRSILNKNGSQKPTYGNNKTVANKFLDRVKLSPVEMRASLEKSLRALQTEHLDYFFIHEPHHHIANLSDLLNEAGKLKAEGKIRAFGLAYMQNQHSLHQTYIENSFDLLQFDNSPGCDGYTEVVSKRGLKPNVIFSPLRGPATLKPAEKLVQLFDDFPQSVVLCSMFDPRHLAENAALLNNDLKQVLKGATL